MTAQPDSGRASASQKLGVSVALTFMASTGGPLSASTVGNDGNFSYNVASVPLIAESVKLLFSFLFVLNDSSTDARCSDEVEARPVGEQDANDDSSSDSEKNGAASSTNDRKLLQKGDLPVSRLSLLRETIGQVTWSSSLIYLPPSLMFIVINNLRIWNMRYIDPASAELLGTLRIALTAIMLRLFLRRSFSRTQWASIAMLSLSVALSQMEGVAVKAVAGLRGLLGVAVVASCSASASVYMEWALKGDRSKSMHVQNAQIYGWGVLLNGAMYLSTRTKTAHGIAPRSLIHGYTPLTWLLVLHLACSGLIVAWLLKYSDSITKIQATSASLFLTTLISAAWLGTLVSANLMAGVVLCSASLFMYHGLLLPPSFSAKRRTREQETTAQKHRA